MTYSSKLTLNPSNERWYPMRVKHLEEHLQVFIKRNDYFSYDDINPLMKNIAYSLQYIEFLNQVSIDINLSSVLQNQNVKSFIIHGASIIEAIFNYVVISAGYGNTTTLTSITKFRSPHYQIGDKKYLNEIEIFKYIDEKNVMMTFDQLAKKVESKKLLGDDFQKYRPIKIIRTLRNRIHIQSNNGTFDTDWWEFNNERYIILTKSTLHAILTSALFKDSSHLDKFNYLAC